MFGTIAEWVVIAFGLLQVVFMGGMYIQNEKNKNKKVEDHEKEIKDLTSKIKNVEENVHSLKTSFGAFKSANDAKTSIVLMLLFQVCNKQGIDTDMAQFILNTDTDDSVKHKK